MRSRRGVPIVLAIFAVAVFASTTVADSSFTATPRCDGVRLRTGPAGWYPTKATVDEGSTVTLAAEVTGARWSTLCGGITYTGTTWAQVVAIDGTPTEEAYDAPALYAAFGLLQVTSSAPTAGAPSAAPTAAATTVPSIPPASAAPSPLPSPSPSQTAMASLTSPTPTPAAVRPGSPPPTATSAAAGPVVVPDDATGLSPVGQLVVLGLALASVGLAWFAYAEQRRRERARYMAKLPSSRLKDVLE